MKFQDVKFKDPKFMKFSLKHSNFSNNFIICLLSIFSVIKVIIGERAKRARHSQVCSIENRGYIYYYIYIIVRANFVLITRKEGGA